ncbi:hypothetical protein W823_09155 [Williamsia sp. D3]|nr:hypothetical protein W823_09155 [Williamsia sp. D3]
MSDFSRPRRPQVVGYGVVVTSLTIDIVPQRIALLDGEFKIEHTPPGVEMPGAPDGLMVATSPEGTTRVRRAEPDEADRWLAFYSGGSAHGLDEPGMTVSIAAPLSASGCPIFVVSTAVADVVLVPRVHLGNACAALRSVGHIVSV